jgi:hypothetical protein
MSTKNLLLTPRNTVFMQKGDFPSAIIKVKKSADLSVELHFSRVYLRRSFPAAEPYRYISVSGRDEKEVGMIPDITEFPEGQRKLLKAELDRLYFMPKILSVQSVKDRFGRTTFQVTTDIGPLTFTVQDVYRNLFRLPDGRLILTDIDGNRFEITDPKALDKKSYKKIELYI